MPNYRPDIKPLHSTISHQRAVTKYYRISKKDMLKLDEFRNRFISLSEQHRQLFDTYGIHLVKNYLDPTIADRYGLIAANDLHNLYEEWCNLRQDMEIFLERKNLPLKYPERSWMRPFIGCESGSRNYDGNYTTTGFDSGPAKWCSITLDGMTCEMHQRLHLQRIEWLSAAGFATGIIGIALSLITFLR